jgi:hypothetical protein
MLPLNKTIFSSVQIKVTTLFAGSARLIIGRALRNGIIAETRALKYEAENGAANLPDA